MDRESTRSHTHTHTHRTWGLIVNKKMADIARRLCSATMIASAAIGVTSGETRAAEPAITQAPSDGSVNSQRSGRAESNEIAEIVVTAQKRSERLQDVPISISVVGGKDLDRSTVRDATEALRYVPGISVNKTGAHPNSAVSVRGVSPSQTIGMIGTTAYYVDSVPFNLVRTAFGPDPSAYDLDRIEVLKGPQGTLYGANALNGVVRILTKDADLDSFEVKARGMTSSTEGGDLNYRGDLAVGVPLIEGKLAARAVLSYQDFSGWIDGPTNENVNDLRNRDARLKLNAQPTEQLSVELSAWLSRADNGAPAQSDDNEQVPYDQDEPVATDFDTYGLTLTYESPWFTVTSLTGYLKWNQWYDLVNVNPMAPAAPTTYLRLDGYDADMFAQELIFRSPEEGFWRWSLGGMYRDARDSLMQCFVPVTVPDGCEGYLPSDYELTSESYAIFGELTRRFADGRFEVTAGLRYYSDESTIRELMAFGITLPPEALAYKSETFSATTPRVVLTWHPTKELTTYASYSQGFRSGMNQGGPVLRNTGGLFPSSQPDTLDNYELGAKGSLWDGRLAFQTALFYVDWQDVQMNRVVTQAEFPSLPFPSTSAAVNGTSASGVGFEFGFTAAPVSGLELGATFSWNDLKWDGQTFSNNALFWDEGERLPNSVEYTAGGSATYKFPVGGLQAQISTSVTYVSALPDFVVVAAGQRTLNEAGDDITLAQASVSLNGPSGWMASLFVDNLANWDGATFRGDSVAQPYPWLRNRVRPRTVGLQLEYRF